MLSIGQMHAEIPARLQRRRPILQRSRLRHDRKVTDELSTSAQVAGNRDALEVGLRPFQRLDRTPEQPVGSVHVEPRAAVLGELDVLAEFSSARTRQGLSSS
jgi:hypothetical protein